MARGGRFAALQHRDFRLFWSGQGVSMLGTQVQRVAVAWQLYLLTHSAWRLGLLGLFRVAPVIVLALGGGVIADAVDRRKLLVVTQALLALSSAALAILSATGHASATAIYACTLVAGCASAVENPTRQALVSNLVPAADLEGALSLNVTVSQVARVAGPAVAGLLLGVRGGVAIAYAVDALSFGAVIGALLALRHRALPTAGARVSLDAALDGLRFVVAQPVILGMTLLDFLGTFFADATMLLPIFAVEVLHAGPRALGWLTLARALGSVVAAAAMSWLPPVRRRGVVVLSSVAIYGAVTAIFGASRSLPLSLLALAAAGAADTVSVVVRQTVRQLLTPNELRGRMGSVAMIFFVGGPQLGEVEAGALAGAWGAPASVIFGGVACALVAGGVAIAWPSLRRHRAGD